MYKSDTILKKKSVDFTSQKKWRLSIWGEESKRIQQKCKFNLEKCKKSKLQSQAHSRSGSAVRVSSWIDEFFLSEGEHKANFKHILSVSNPLHFQWRMNVCLIVWLVGCGEGSVHPFFVVVMYKKIKFIANHSFSGNRFLCFFCKRYWLLCRSFNENQNRLQNRKCVEKHTHTHTWNKLWSLLSSRDTGGAHVCDSLCTVSKTCCNLLCVISM